jgi:microcystin-dependent protein
MATVLKFKRYTTEQAEMITGQAGELMVNTTKKTVIVHDGTTQGGTTLATEGFATSAISTALASYSTSTSVDSKIATALTPYYTSTQTNSAISTAINNLVDGAPTALNTLNELAAAINDDASYASTITTALGNKAPLASPAFTGTPTAPTPTKTDDSTKIATTEYVQDNIADYAPLASPTFTGTPASTTPTTTDSTTKIATTAFTHALVQAILPAGVITMWSGAIATIPSGWVLCNGSNGTPDLRDRFIVGAGGGGYSVGDNGGSSSTTLTTTELPSHTHTGTTGSAGAHDHFIANGDTVNATTSALSASNTLAKNGSQASTSFNYLLGGTATAASQGLTDSEPDHTHTFTTGSTGSGSPFENRPPYYALAYIMKTYS